MNIQIKHRITAEVLFEHDCENNSTRVTLELAIKKCANLEGANLEGANLEGANLEGANLARVTLECANLDRANLARANLDRAKLGGANLARAKLGGANLARVTLECANLARANLARAYLEGANLEGANLARVYLGGANLGGANLEGANLKNKEKLIGRRPIFQIGPIGSRCAYFVAYITDQGLRFDAGCQKQITREVFEQRLADTHDENEHAAEYRAALALIDAHAEIWTPKSAEDAEVSAQAGPGPHHGRGCSGPRQGNAGH